MKIHLYCYFWNEARMLPYFFRHYAPLVDWIFCYDQNSNDGSVELARKAGRNISVFTLPIKGMRDTEFIAFSQQEYKMSRGTADWIIWVDVDEFIYHPTLRDLLADYQQQGVEVPLTQGYQMVSTRYPSGAGQIYEEVNHGYPSEVFCKPVVFRPHLDMQWVSGKHKLLPGFNPVRSATAEIKLLHYRFLSPEYVKERNQRNWERMDEAHRRGGHNWTCRPGYTGEHSYPWYMKLKDQTFPKVI